MNEQLNKVVTRDGQEKLFFESGEFNDILNGNELSSTDKNGLSTSYRNLLVTLIKMKDNEKKLVEQKTNFENEVQELKESLDNRQDLIEELTAQKSDGQSIVQELENENKQLLEKI